MNEDLNKFFAVKNAVEKHHDAKFFAYHSYAKGITLFIAISYACTSIIALIGSMVTTSRELFSWGVGLGIFLILFVFSSNTKVGIFLMRELSFLLFGTIIEEKTRHSKREAKRELNDLQDAFPSMETSGNEWKIVAQDAYKILNLIPIRSN